MSDGAALGVTFTLKFACHVYVKSSGPLDLIDAKSYLVKRMLTECKPCAVISGPQLS